MGATGQLGRALHRVLRRQFYVKQVSRQECNVADSRALLETLRYVKPELIINAAAYTAVDAAEREQTIAFDVNATAPKLMAEYSARIGIPYIHFSTDYVFDGSGQRPWREDDEPKPINVYGESKLTGDRAVLNSGATCIIIRTSWLYDTVGRNFLNSILRQASERTELCVVDDQFGAPTTASYVAETTVKILLSRIRYFGATWSGSEIVNVTASGCVSWHGFAQAIIHQVRGAGHPLKIRRVIPISTQKLSVAARRPLNSRLSLERLSAEFDISPPNWRELFDEIISS